MRRNLVSYCALLTLVFTLTGTSITKAQGEGKSVTTILIENGKVWINNIELAPSGLPKGLNLSGLRLESHFIGVGQPLVNLGDQIFKIYNGGLIPFSEAESSSMGRFVLEEADFIGPTEPNNLRIEYLNRLENTNQMLYRWLTEEKRLDLQTRKLAHKIRQTKDSTVKMKMMEDLNSQLNEIFDLKQKNRMAEISHLELQLEDLRSGFEKRESQRKALIENRIIELLSSY